VPVFLDGSGTVLSSSAENNRYSYTGREWDDDVEHYHFRARPYEPLTGRFLSRDPIGFEGSPWNLFEFVASNPTVHKDPSGQDYDWCKVTKAERRWIAPQRKKGNRKWIQRLFCEYECECFGRDGPVKHAIDLQSPVPGKMDRDRCEDQLAVIYAYEDCDDDDDQRDPEPRPTPEPITREPIIKTGWPGSGINILIKHILGIESDVPILGPPVPVPAPIPVRVPVGCRAPARMPQMR